MSVPIQGFEPPQDRLDGTEQTDWSLVLMAKQSSANNPAARAAQERLLRQYEPAIRSYLFAGVRDADAVDTLYQTLALRLAQGRLGNVDPQRGRFRHYLKTVLRHIISDHHQAHGRRLRPLDAIPAEPAEEQSSFVLPDEALLNESYRETLLLRTWGALRLYEERTGKPFWTILSFLAQNPQVRPLYPEIVRRFGHLIKYRDKEQGARKIVHRARAEFASLLLEDLTHTLEEPTLAELEQELIELRLLKYVGKEIDRRRRASNVS